jgi:D-glycero-beta-D-manno-heptose-7-phosphate kinase
MTTTETLFNAFASKKVLIIGDVMVDSYMWGKVSRISPEAPVPVVAVHKKESRLGGAANVALNIKALGATPILCSVVGADFYGQQFLDLLEKEGMSGNGILSLTSRHTTVKTRVISQSHQMLRVDEEIEEVLAAEEEDKLFTQIDKIIMNEKPDVIIFEDYDKGTITKTLIERTVTLAHKQAIPVAVDPKKKNFHSYKKVSLFKPNLKELQEGLKSDVDFSHLEEMKELVQNFRRSMQIDAILLTLSEHGVLMCNDQGCEIFPAHIRNIADVSGAGDTVISVAALALAAKYDPSHVAVLSNLAGGQVCEKVGVVPVDSEQLKREITELKILA